MAGNLNPLLSYLREKLSNHQGLTVIEMLIALALFSIVIAGTFHLFSFVYHSWGLVEKETRLQEVRFVFQRLGRDIKNAPPTEDNLIAVTVENGGNVLVLGPEQKGQIRYELVGNKLYRKERSDTGEFYDAPGEVVELFNSQEKKGLFKLEGKVVEVLWIVNYGSSEKDFRPQELKGMFTIRNGQIEEEK